LHINHQTALPFRHFTFIPTTKRHELQTTVSKQRKWKMRRSEISWGSLCKNSFVTENSGEAAEGRKEGESYKIKRDLWDETWSAAVHNVLCVRYGDRYRRLDSIRDVQNIILQLVQLYESEQFTCDCSSVQIVVIFSMRTSTRPSHRVRFQISSFLTTILLPKMSSAEFTAFRKSVNSVRRLNTPYQLIPKQHYQRCLRSKVGTPIFLDSPNHKMREEQILETSWIRNISVPLAISNSQR
jgi:hypothetical protein